MPEDLYGPMRSSGWWTLLAVALVVLVVAWVVWVLWSTRRPHRARLPAPVDPAAALADERARTLSAIDRLEAAHARGQLDARELFQHLSPLVRRYVYDTSGTPAHVQALADLRRDDDAALAATVAWLYPEEFAADAPGAVAEGLARARWYVATFPAPVELPAPAGLAGEGHRP